MEIASDFEGGHIEVLSVRPLGQDVLLSIPADSKNGAFRQWFCFDALGTEGAEQRFVIDNASACTFKDGFAAPYRVYASTDLERWERVSTSFDGRRLSFSSTPSGKRTRYAYYPPFSSQRVDALVARATGVLAAETLVSVGPGADVVLLTAGNAAPSAPRLWVTAQQHPGEHMAGWFVEGLVDRLLAGDDAVKALLDRALLCVVPSMNPSGVRAGNHRTNAHGVDLNREWEAPGDGAPEIRAVQAAMRERGVHTFVDVHGDERIPYVFGQPPDDHPKRNAYARETSSQLVALFDAYAPDFQTEHRYPSGKPSRPNLKVASVWIENTFGCPALTIEMPFSDNANAPQDAGFSLDRARAIGGQTVDVFAALLPHLQLSV